MNDLDDQISQYLRQTLRAEAFPVPWPDANQLAPFLTERYRFLHAAILTQPVLFMLDAAATEESPATVRKHITQVRAKCGWPIIYVRDRVTAYNRKRLIEQQVPFIVPGNQMYLPDLGIDLREHFRKQVTTQSQFRPATQAVLISALLRSDAAPLTTADLAPELGYSTMTLIRAFDELESAKLAESKVIGRERMLHLMGTRREIWNRAQEFLRSPVKAKYFIQAAPPKTLGPKAGFSALAAYSMLAEPEHPVFAMSREQWTAQSQTGKLVVLEGPESDCYEIETWTYAPRPFRDPARKSNPELNPGLDIVDPLSLYLSLQESADERTTQALDQMLESLPW